MMQSVKVPTPLMLLNRFVSKDKGQKCKNVKWVLNNFEYLHTSEARKENVFIHKLRMKTSQCEDVELLSHSTMVGFGILLSKI